MSIFNTSGFAATLADGRSLNFIETKHGTTALTDGGPVPISDLLKSFRMLNNIVRQLNVEEIKDDQTRFSFDCGLAMYDALTTWGAAIENDEDDGNGEEDDRDLPRALSDAA